MADHFDLVVIGAGSGGVRAARMAATHGARVAIIEEYRVGGTCVIRGCVPKKLYVFASRFPDLFDVAKSFGWQVDARFDWSVLKANKDREIDRLEAAYVANLERAGVEIIRDRGCLDGPEHVVLAKSGRVLTAGHVLIATGGHPFMPDIPGAALGINSNDVFNLEALPESILIEGAGYIAVEFASVFSGLGVKTTVCYRRDKLLRGFDEDVREGVAEGLRARGVAFKFNTTIAALEQNAHGIGVQFGGGGVAEYGAVMFATGRSANVHGLGLETAGIRLTAAGAVEVDEYSRSSSPTVHAVGDVTGRVALTPVAIREGSAIAETLFNNNPTKVDHSLIASAVFGDPEVGTIGLSEAAAREAGDIDVYVTRFRPMLNSLSERPEKMMFKLITEPNGGKVLGCHILGPGAAEMIQLVAIPMAMGASKADFDRAVAVHPTAAEELVTLKAPSYRFVGGKRLG